MCTFRARGDDLLEWRPADGTLSEGSLATCTMVIKTLCATYCQRAFIMYRGPEVTQGTCCRALRRSSWWGGACRHQGGP
eukprot:3885339-Alexandrium_andersonii.AAC.1